MPSDAVNTRIAKKTTDTFSRRFLCVSGVFATFVLIMGCDDLASKEDGNPGKFFGQFICG